MTPEVQEGNCCIESDLFAFGIILLELDNAATFDFSKVTNKEFAKLLDGNIFESYPLNRSSAIYEIAKIFLSKSPRRQRECS